MTAAVLVFAEQREGKLRKSSLEAVSEGRRLAKALGGRAVAVVVGKGVSGLTEELGRHGAERVRTVDADALARYHGPAYAEAVAQAAREEDAVAVLFGASAMGRELGPRVAALLDTCVAADCTSLRAEGGRIVVRRPVYAGKAMATATFTRPPAVASLRPNVFAADPSQGGAPEIVAQAAPAAEAGWTLREIAVQTARRPELTEATVVVTGGRGLKGPEHFHLVESLADALGAAVGASRAVVDEGWRPHAEQVGQTGRTVSPNLYVACGVSGAIQHLAGMRSSKVIVAINKDKDAPIFKVADYGIVGDVFEVLPALTEAVRREARA